MPFRGVLAVWLAHWQHVCSQWVSCVHDVVPLLDAHVDRVVEALTERLQGTGSGSLYCPRAAPTQGWGAFHAHTISV